MNSGSSKDQGLIIKVICADCRVWPPLTQAILSQDSSNPYLLAFAGTTKPILDIGARSYMLREQFGLLLCGQKIAAIHLYHHLDCRGWGGQGIHASRDAEIAFHAEHCRVAGGILLGRFPHIQLAVHGHIVGLDGRVVEKVEAHAMTATR